MVFLTRKLVTVFSFFALFFSACADVDSQCEAMDSPNDPDPNAEHVSVLSYNIGNGILNDGPYSLRIKDQGYENYIASIIQSMQYDIVALQEVLPPTACKSVEEKDPNHTCYRADKRPPPIRRLLGDNYTIACDQRDHIECIGVHTSFGSIEGQELGSFQLSGAQTAPLPHRPCSYRDKECKDLARNCDSESSISTVLIKPHEGDKIRVVHAHPTAVGNKCLQHQLQQAFDFVDENDTIVVGDFNFSPTTVEDLAATAIWRKYVGRDRRFSNHFVPGQSCKISSIDFGASDFDGGRCSQEWDIDSYARSYSDVRDIEVEDFDIGNMIGEPADHQPVLCDLYR